MFKRLFTLICLCCFTLPCFADSLQGFSAGHSAATVQSLIPAMHKGEGYGEKYTFNAEFGERGSMYFSLTISNFGIGDFKMEAKGRFTLDGEDYSWKKELDDDEWKYKKDQFYIKAGPATISGTPNRLVMTATKSKHQFQAVFTPKAPSWRPGQGQVKFGSNISEFTVFPLMDVEAKVKLKDKDEEVLTGYGFGSHSWSDLMPYEQFKSTVDFRGIAGDATVYMRIMQPVSDYGKEPLRYLLVTKGNQILAESLNFTVTPTATYTDKKHDNKYQVAESFTVSTPDIKGTVTKSQLRQRKDQLASLNFAARQIAKQYAKPMLYDYDMQFSFDVKGQKIEGIGRYEVNHLNK